MRRHRADTHSFAHGKHVVGDFADGKLYELTDDVFTDNGAVITKRRTTPHISGEGRRIFYNEFMIDIEAGVGLDGVGQGVDPKMMMRFSDDGGHSWSNEKWAGMGKIGQRKFRAVWRKLGQSRDRVYEVSITDPVKVVLISADLEFVLGGK